MKMQRRIEVMELEYPDHCHLVDGEKKKLQKKDVENMKEGDRGTRWGLRIVAIVVEVVLWEKKGRMSMEWKKL